MKCLAIFLTTAWIATCSAGPALADDWASVNQTGSYTYTQVKQDGDRTKVKVRQIDPRKFDRIRERVAAKVAHYNAKYGAWSDPNRFSAWNDAQGSNSVVLNQSGSENTASATQYGTNDSVAIDQVGSANAAYTVQRGDNLRAAAAQSGDHNITFILQRNRGGFRQPKPQSFGDPSSFFGARNQVP